MSVIFFAEILLRAAKGEGSISCQVGRSGVTRQPACSIPELWRTPFSEASAVLPAGGGLGRGFMEPQGPLSCKTAQLCNSASRASTSTLGVSSLFLFGFGVLASFPCPPPPPHPCIDGIDSQRDGGRSRQFGYPAGNAFSPIDSPPPHLRPMMKIVKHLCLLCLHFLGYFV